MNTQMFIRNHMHKIFDEHAAVSTSPEMLVEELEAYAQSVRESYAKHGELLKKTSDPPRYEVFQMGACSGLFRINDLFLRASVVIPNAYQGIMRQQPMKFDIEYGSELFFTDNNNFQILRSKSTSVPVPPDIALLGYTAAWRHFVQDIETYAVLGVI